MGRVLVVNSLLPPGHNNKSLDTLALGLGGRLVAVDARYGPSESNFSSGKLEDACEQLAEYLDILCQVSEKKSWFRLLYKSSYRKHYEWAAKNKATWNFKIKVALALGLDPLRQEEWQDELRSTLRDSSLRQERMPAVIAPTAALTADCQAKLHTLSAKYGWPFGLVRVESTTPSRAEWVR